MRTRFLDLDFGRFLSLISSSAAVSNDSVRSTRIPVLASVRRYEGIAEDMLGSGTEGVISMSRSEASSCGEVCCCMTCRWVVQNGGIR